MGQNSSIEWTHHTFNPWWGCLKVSPGCEHCYALTLSKRFGHDIWGPAKTTTRRTFGPKHWAEPIKWNADAVKTGERKRVFCASMADVFEAHPILNDERVKLWQLIEQTPMLDWLLLTKRPENIAKMMPIRWGADPHLGIFDDSSLMPHNIWLGTSCEDQQRADERIPELLKVPVKVRFLSCEPLLGSLDLTEHLKYGEFTPYGPRPLHWIICGGESGPGARPMHPDWARGLRDQCGAAGVAFHFKQWGEYVPQLQLGHPWHGQGVEWGVINGTGDYFKSATPWNGRQGEPPDNEYALWRAGKHAAGRLLDGRTWDQFPA